MFNWLRQRRYSMSIGNNNITGSITMTLGTDVQDSTWINADTPPDDCRYVWVSYKPIPKSYPNSVDRPRRYCMGFYNHDMKRWILSDDDRLKNYVCEVTHWQKITPPKEKPND